MLAGVIVTDQVRPGVINIHEGGWYDPLEPGKVGTLDKHGNVNVLSSDEGDSKLSQGNPRTPCSRRSRSLMGPCPT